LQWVHYGQVVLEVITRMKKIEYYLEAGEESPWEAGGAKMWLKTC
jgi:hypothetical protein